MSLVAALRIRDTVVLAESAQERDQAIVKGGPGLRGVADVHLAALIMYGPSEHNVATILDDSVPTPKDLRLLCASPAGLL